MSSTDKHEYIITWHVAVIRINPRGRNFISLGICEHTQRTAFIAIFDPDNAATQEFLKVLTIKNVYASPNGCEDGHYCLDLKCPLNKTTAKTFKQYGVDTDEKLQGLSRHIEEFRSQINLHESLHTRKEGVAVYYEKPALIIKKNKGKVG